MKKTVLKVFAIFFIGMVGGVFADQIFWPYFVMRPLLEKYNLDSRPVYVTETKEIFIKENEAVLRAAKDSGRSVVVIEGPTATGSGLVVTADGLIVTLAELVSQGSVSVFVDGKEYSAMILKKDIAANLALLKIEESALSTVGFGKIEKLEAGERVFLVGRSEKGESVVNEGVVRRLDGEKIKTNISESKELRGSVLFNVSGEVLGINTISKEGAVEAIPVSQVKLFIGL